jgi:hypothetical protein
MYDSMTMLPYAWFSFWLNLWAAPRKQPKLHTVDPIAAAGGGSASVVTLNSVANNYSPLSDVTR